MDVLLIDLNADVALVTPTETQTAVFSTFFFYLGSNNQHFSQSLIPLPVSILIQIQIKFGLFSILKHDPEHDWIYLKHGE